MNLGDLVERLQPRDVRGDAAVQRVSLDSRQAGPGVLFAAVPGSRADGHDYAAAAAAAGSPLLVERWPDDLPASAVGLLVADSRRAAALAAQALHGDPAADMLTFGITGTNGKTSTVAILRTILHVAGLRAGSLGTTGIAWNGRSGRHEHVATHTTPDGPALWEWVGRMRDDGVQALALELSSHALDQGRAAGLPLSVGAWTNLSRDHLDYHGDLDEYERAKGRLLTEQLATWGRPKSAAVLFVDDPAVARWGSAHPRTLRVSLRVGAAERGEAEVSPRSEPIYRLDGTECVVTAMGTGLKLRTGLIGPHNLINALMAGGSAIAAGITPEAVENGWKATPGAPGRLERVVREDRVGPTVLVDYAHSDDALARVLSGLRPLTGGRITTVFGCGGDRDAGKRPLMAAAAAAGSDALVLTSDNPRGEDPEAILDAMEPGLTGCDIPWQRIADRAAAIGAAIGSAGADDVVLIAGKGHETYQEVGGERLAFDDRLVARQALRDWPA